MAVMNANEILRRGATTAQPNQFNLALPKLPTAVQTYTPYTQMDPANYIANVAGFLPVNAQHLSNTTNGYAYNSLADVVFNYKAWQKRWGEDSWLNTPIGYIPRVIADTGLLLKDTIVNPVVDSVQLALSNPNDDLGLLKGLSAGVNTAVLNTLVNVGNSVDALANPVKGLVLEGPEGFVRGLVGMEDSGRKQYDYSDYIDFGPGFTAGVGELLVSTGAELISDPLNWLTFFAGGTAKTVANTGVDAATAGLKTTLREAAERSVTASDDLAKSIATATKGAMTSADVKAVIKQITNDTGVVVSENVENYLKNVDDLTSAIVENTVKTAPGKKFAPSLKEAANSLATSKETRFRAGLLKKVDYTPAVQKTSAALLNKFDPNTISKSVLRLNQFDKVADQVTSYAALTASGLLPGYAIKKLGVDPVVKKVRQAKLDRYATYVLEHADEMREILNTLDNEYKINFEQLLDEQSLDVLVNLKNISPDTLSSIDTQLTDALDKYSAALLTVAESARGNEKTVKYLTTTQQEALQKVNQTISESLGPHGINNLTEYIEYVHSALRLNPTSTQLKLLDKKLIDIEKLLTLDLTDPATLELHKNISKAYDNALKTISVKYNWTQDQSMADAATRVKAYREQQNIQIAKAEKVNLYNEAIADAVKAINKEYDFIKDTLPSLINSDFSDSYGDTTVDVITDAVDRRIVDTNFTLNEAYNKFLDAYDDYNRAISTDDTVDNVLNKSEIKTNRTIKQLDKSKNKKHLDGKRLTKKKALDPEEAMVAYVKAYNNLREHLSRLPFKDRPLAPTTNDTVSVLAWDKDMVKRRTVTYVLERANTVRMREVPSAKAYIETLPNFSDIVKEAHDDLGVVKLSDYFDGMLVSYTMRVSATRFALDLIEDTGTVTETRQINVASYILELNRSGKSSAEIAETLKSNKCVLFNTGNDFIWTETEVDDIINRARAVTTSAEEIVSIAPDPSPLFNALHAIINTAPTVNKSTTSDVVTDVNKTLNDVVEQYPNLISDVKRLAQDNPALEDSVATFIDAYNKLTATPPLKSSIQSAGLALQAAYEFEDYADVIEHIGYKLPELLSDFEQLLNAGTFGNMLPYLRIALNYGKDLSSPEVFHKAVTTLITTYKRLKEQPLNQISYKQFIAEYSLFAKTIDALLQFGDIDKVKFAKGYNALLQTKNFLKLTSSKNDYLSTLSDLDAAYPNLPKDLSQLATQVPEFRDTVKEFTKLYTTLIETPLDVTSYETFVETFNKLIDVSDTLVALNKTYNTKATKLLDKLKHSATKIFDISSGRGFVAYADEAFGTQRVPFANIQDFLNGYDGEITDTRTVQSTVMQIVNAAKDPDSGIYKLLNSSEYENVAAIQIMKATLTRLSDFKTLVDNYNAFLNRTPMTDVQREAFIDALVTQIKRGHRFREDKLLSIANEMYEGASLYYRTHMDIDSLAADNQFFKAASEVSEDDPKYQIAQELLASLEAGVAHMADVDNDNLWRYILLNDDLHNLIFESAGSRYIVVFDTETTGDIDNPLTKVFQLSAKILDTAGNEVKRLNYIIDPGDTKPSRTILKKVAPSTSGNIDVWWLDNIVNNPDKVADFNTAIDLFYKELTTLNMQNGFMFVGQNITNFDMKLLRTHASVDFLNLLKTSTSFDTLHYLLSLNTPELFGVQKELFIDNLAQFFTVMKQNNNTALLQDIITYADIKNFSEVKKILRGDADAFTTSDASKVADLDSVLADPDVQIDLDLLEDCIDFIQTQWGQVRNSASTPKLYTATKANIADEASRQVIHTLLQNQRVNIDVPIGSNIMTYFNKYVNKANVQLNPRTAISFELENVFSRAKLEEAFPNLVVSKEFATGLTLQSREIMHLRSNLTEDVVTALRDEASIFFKSDKGKFGNARYVYDAVENNADIMVAAYLYYNYRRSSERYDIIFNHKSTKLLHRRGASGNTALAHTVDPHTNRPKAMFADDNLYSYREKVEATKYNPLDAITEYNVDHNIYGAHKAALNELHSHNSALMLEVEKYLRRFSDSARMAEERKFRSYNKVLSEVAKREVLERENRADALLKEAKLRFGRVCFTDTKDLDLNDFIEKGIYVCKTAKASSSGEIVYVYKLCIPKDLWYNAEDLVLQPTVLKQLDGVSDTAVQLINKSRQLNAAYVHNVGKSRGDVITKELLDEFDADLPEDIVSKLISTTELESAGYFKKLHANHTFIWSSELQEVSENFVTSDPFNQVFYNTERFMKQRYGLLASYLNLLYNEANGIQSSKLFNGVAPKDLVKYFKESDMVVVYLQPGKSILTKTGTGVDGASYRLKQIDIINEKSIELAKKLNAHVIPRTQYLQMAHVINTFELPPIAKFASAISTYYKLGYLSSIGFVVRNIIDSNYKNRLSLDGNVSLPKQIQHLFSTIHLLQNYNTVGAQYTKHMGQYFKSDLEYDIFYNICKNADAPDIKAVVSKLYPKRTQKQVDKYIDKVLEKFTDHMDVLKTLDSQLMDKKLFACVDTFIQHGPSVGLNRSILNSIATNNTSDTEGLHSKFIKLFTERTPVRFVYDWNDMVEQSARLSLFLQRLEAGDTIDGATRTVIKTHFDYSDKSLGMLYTEIAFPFMSFSYKNLEFWIDTAFKNPRMLRELENILRPGLNYNSLFNPDQEAYAEFDYTFDWSKDVTSFEARAPWQMINAARLYHILSGNLVIDTDKIVRYDNGYGEQDAELFAVFKLSPSVLDAVRMLYNPIDTYQQRLLPPAEVLCNTLLDILEGKAPIEDLSVNAFLNQLPLVGAPLQRLGVGSKSDNNIARRVQDLGLPAAVSSLFTAAYVPKKDHVYIYDGNYNVLNPKATYPRFNKMYYRGGGFSMNYLARRTYSSIYTPDVPTYRITKYARRLPNKSPYRKFKRTQVKTYYFNSLHYGMRDKLIKYRVADKFRHYD